MIAKLRLILSKTADGSADYLQVMSDDMLVNVVLVAVEIEVVDQREDSEG